MSQNKPFISESPKAAITALSSYSPSHIVTNEDLVKTIDTSDEWIQQRTGIKERRIEKDSTKPTSFLAIEAVHSLFEKKVVDPLSIDLILVATVTPDYLVSSTAAYIASEVGAINAFAFDITAACSGFIYGLSIASAYIQSKRYKKIILIGADKMSSIIDPTDRNTAIIFGDGAGCVLIEPSNNEFGFEGEQLFSDGKGRQYLNIKAGGSLNPTTESSLANKEHFLWQEGKTIFKFAVRNMYLAVKKVLENHNLDINEIDYLVPHQANIRILKSVASKLGIDESKVLINIHKFGNTTAGTIPLVLSDYEKEFSKGDKLIFTSFGAGFTWGATYLTWNH